MGMRHGTRTRSSWFLLQPARGLRVMSSLLDGLMAPGCMYYAMKNMGSQLTQPSLEWDWPGTGPGARGLLLSAVTNNVAPSAF